MYILEEKSFVQIQTSGKKIVRGVVAKKLDVENRTSLAEQAQNHRKSSQVQSSLFRLSDCPVVVPLALQSTSRFSLPAHSPAWTT